MSNNFSVRKRQNAIESVICDLEKSGELDETKLANFREWKARRDKAIRLSIYVFTTICLVILFIDWSVAIVIFFGVILSLMPIFRTFNHHFYQYNTYIKIEAEIISKIERDYPGSGVLKAWKIKYKYFFDGHDYGPYQEYVVREGKCSPVFIGEHKLKVLVNPNNPNENIILIPENERRLNLRK